MTPLGNPRTQAEQLYNESQIRTRNPIERTFGIWKRRFPVLALGIRSKLCKVEAIVVATAVLHNMAILLNEDQPPVDAAEEAAIQLVNNVENENVRDWRIEQYCEIQFDP
ncbi:DDE superfamily endonuclease [Popillia japonica]|uniref:DDE superfamily endonuclease n=1 Tax=Popillia japonica TaxID=7064 RepID=A0AAW1LST3_POPJA